MQIRDYFFTVLTTMALLVAPVTHASLIAYQESLDGDLSTSTPSLFTLNTVGVHQWSGSTTSSCTNTAPCTSDLDPFTLDVASGYQIVSASSQVSDVSVNGGWAVLSADFRLAGVINPLFERSHDLLNGTVTVTTDSLPIESGVYGNRAPYAGTIGCVFTPTCSASWDWAFELEVEAVSAVEPSVVSLASIALLGVLGMRRRRCG